MSHPCRCGARMRQLFNESPELPLAKQAPGMQVWWPGEDRQASNGLMCRHSEDPQVPSPHLESLLQFVLNGLWKLKC